MKSATVHCRSAAKVNLTLDILDILPDGYHELRSIIHTVGLYDELLFRFGGPARLSCNRPELAGENNLCLRAARLYCEAAGLDPERDGAEIELTKVIPAGAGLGGGSGNAAATLRAFNGHYQRLDESALHSLARKLGADVPLFLSGGCQLLEGIGEKLTPLPPLAGWLVIAQPPQHGDTATVYKSWDALHHETPATSLDATAALLRAWPSSAVNYEDTTRFLPRLAQGLANDLAPAAMRCGLPVDELAKAILQSGAAGAIMTGSGSAVFGVFEGESEAREACRRVPAVLAESRSGLELQHAFAAPFCREALLFSQSGL